MKGRFGPPFFWLQHREPGEMGEGEGQGARSQPVSLSLRIGQHWLRNGAGGDSEKGFGG